MTYDLNGPPDAVELDDLSPGDMEVSGSDGRQELDPDSETRVEHAKLEPADPQELVVEHVRDVLVEDLIYGPAANAPQDTRPYERTTRPQQADAQK
jgi:hypothetical protein